MLIKTKITVKKFMRLNPWIKTPVDAKRILHDIKTKPAISLEEIIKGNDTGRDIIGITGLTAMTEEGQQ